MSTIHLKRESGERTFADIGRGGGEIRKSPTKTQKKKRDQQKENAGKGQAKIQRTARKKDGRYTVIKERKLRGPTTGTERKYQKKHKKKKPGCAGQSSRNGNCVGLVIARPVKPRSERPQHRTRKENQRKTARGGNMYREKGSESQGPASPGGTVERRPAIKKTG